jgi:hypothetical protein
METRKICELFCDPNFYHFSITALSWFAKRTGEVVASASTWIRVIKQFGLKRRIGRSIRVFTEKTEYQEHWPAIPYESDWECLKFTQT